KSADSLLSDLNCAVYFGWPMMSFRVGLNLLKPRSMESPAPVIIPFDDRIIFVSLLNRAEFSSLLPEVAQSLDAISGIQFLVGGSRVAERWLPGTIRVRSRPRM